MASPLNGTLSVLRMERVRPLTRSELHCYMIRNPRCKKGTVALHMGSNLSTWHPAPRVWITCNCCTFLHTRSTMPKLNHQRALLRNYNRLSVWWHAQHENDRKCLVRLAILRHRSYTVSLAALALWDIQTCLSFSGKVVSCLITAEPSPQLSHFSIMSPPNRSSQAISSNQNPSDLHDVSLFIHIISHCITSYHIKAEHIIAKHVIAEHIIMAYHVMSYTCVYIYICVCLWLCIYHVFASWPHIETLPNQGSNLGTAPARWFSRGYSHFMAVNDVAWSGASAFRNSTIWPMRWLPSHWSLPSSWFQISGKLGWTSHIFSVFFSGFSSAPFCHAKQESAQEVSKFPHGHCARCLPRNPTGRMNFFGKQMWI